MPNTANPAPLTLVSGSEPALVERAVASVMSALRRGAPEAEVTRVSAREYLKGDLSLLVSSSLFAEEQIVHFEDVEDLSDDFAVDIAEYVKSPLPEVWMVLQHGGGQRGSGVIRAVEKAGLPVIKPMTPKKDQDKIVLVKEEVRAAKGTIAPAAASALVAALGSDLAELLAAARQLVDDGGGAVTEEQVQTYFRGRVETPPYEISQALAEGKGPTAILLARQAFATGVSPVVIVSVIATEFRDLAKVKVPGITDRQLGMQPWRATKIRGRSSRWSEDQLGKAILAIARADSAVKGESRTPEAALELCIMEVTRIFREN